jgi:cob(I)alamin adenosyltransferase
MKIYTRTGDDGSTSLAGGRRVPKFHVRIEALGSIDELNSWIGLLRGFKENETRKDFLVYIQDQLMRCSSVIAVEKKDLLDKITFPDSDCCSKIEKEIDKMDAGLPVCAGFIIPGGHYIVSYCQIARCVCRRAERDVLKINSGEKVPQIVVILLNRLSDYLFVLSRTISVAVDNQEDMWSV